MKHLRNNVLFLISLAIIWMATADASQRQRSVIGRNTQFSTANPSYSTERSKSIGTKPPIPIDFPLFVFSSRSMFADYNVKFITMKEYNDQMMLTISYLGLFCILILLLLILYVFCFRHKPSPVQGQDSPLRNFHSNNKRFLQTLSPFNQVQANSQVQGQNNDQTCLPPNVLQDKLHLLKNEREFDSMSMDFPSAPPQITDPHMENRMITG